MNKGLLIVSALVLASAITAQSGNGERTALIDKMHAYYVKQFDDLKMTKEGVFGTSRIESSKIKNHDRSGGDPGYQSKDWYNTVQIYGSHGKPLVAGKTEFRYNRLPNGLPYGYKEVDMAYRTPSESRAMASVKAGLIDTAVKRWASGNHSPCGATYGHVYMEARPILMDKKECLSCHTGMKLNQPVAVMVYTVGRRSKE
jgi:hypothetical protein